MTSPSDRGENLPAISRSRAAAGTALAVAIVALILPRTGMPTEAHAGQKGPVRLAGVTQSWQQSDRTLEHVLSMLDRAASTGAQVVCLPEDCVPTDGGPTATAALKEIAEAAGKRSLYVAANLKEQADGKTFSTSYLIGPDGHIVGKYCKSHRLPDEPIALGDALPVFDTALGRVGLMIGTDALWPEVAQVLALKGARLILWSNGVRPVPQTFSWEAILHMRAFDGHVALVHADYDADLPYLCSNWPGYTGLPIAQGCVVDADGIIVANTGFRPGAATAAVDLDGEKDVYHLTFQEDRALFHYLVDANVKRLVHRPEKRKIKVVIAQVTTAHGPNPRPDSTFFEMLDRAGATGPDVILMAEFGFPTDTDDAAKTFALIAGKAREYGTYIVIGGLRDPQVPYKSCRRASWAYFWNRQGEVIGKYRISQYGDSTELPVFRTDFGVVGLMLCGDIYSPEICRALALQGAELILCGSQSWGASGTFNLWMQQARAIDNSVYLATAHFPFSDVAQRSYLIDPYGFVVAASPYWDEGVFAAEIDLDAPRTWFAASDKPGRAGKPGYLAAYYPETIPEKRTDLGEVLLGGRRPELYGAIVDKTLAGLGISEATREKMERPRPGGNGP